MYTKILNFVTLLVALSVAIAAAYLSVVGLMIIFSAEAYTVAIIVSILETAKFVTVAFSHAHWKQFNWKIKSYFINGRPI